MTSIVRHLFFDRTIRSAGQLGLNALKTAYPLFNKSMDTISSCTAPTVPVEMLKRGPFIVLHSSASNFFLHEFEQNLLAFLRAANEIPQLAQFA